MARKKRRPGLQNDGLAGVLLIAPNLAGFQGGFEAAYVMTNGGPRGMRVDARNAIAIPARRSVAYSEAFFQPGKPPGNKQIFPDALGYAKMNPNLMGALDFMTVLQEQVDRLLLGEADVMSVARAIARRADEELGKFGARKGIDKPVIGR